MRKVMSEVISVHVIVVDEATTIEALCAEIEAHIVPMGRPHLVVGVLRVSKVLREWHRQRPGFKKGHLALEVLIFARVVLFLIDCQAAARGLTYL